MRLLPPADPPPYLLYRLAHKNAIASVAVLSRFHDPNRVLAPACSLLKLLELGRSAVLHEVGQGDDAVDVLLAELVVEGQVLEEGIFVAEHEVVAEVVVHAFGCLEWPQLPFSLLFRREALQLLAELRVEKTLGLDIVLFLVALLFEEVYWLRLLICPALSVDSGLVLELRPHELRKGWLVGLGPPPSLLHYRLDQVAVVAPPHVKLVPLLAFFL